MGRDGSIDSLIEQIRIMRVTHKHALESLRERCARQPEKLYEMVQSGAGCCGPAIGRGSRLDQAARMIRDVPLEE